MKLIHLAALCTLFCGSLPLFASPTDDEAIIRLCGHPLGEHRAVSQVNNQLQRDLYYPDDVVMHFNPSDGGWTLGSGWVKHLPLTRESMADRFPCVHDALIQAAAQPTPVADPTIIAQTAHQRPQGDTFGIPHLWLIFALILLLIVALVWPRGARKIRKTAMPEPRNIKRKPEVVMEAERESARIRRIEAERASLAPPRGEAHPY